MPLPVYPGELEELVLWKVAVLEGTAYSVSLADELQKQTGRSISFSVIHAMLYQLEEKGFVRSTLGEATAARGGRRKRLFRMATFDQDASEWCETRDLIWKRVKGTLKL